MDVDVAFSIDLREREARDVEATAVVEVEHVRLIDHRLVVEAGTALVAGDWRATEDALLHGQDELVRDALFPGDAADELADPEAEVTDGAGRELQQRATRDDLADVERQRRFRRDRAAHHPRVVGRIAGDVGLPLVGVHVDVVHQRARHLDVAQRQAAAGSPAGGPGR